MDDWMRLTERLRASGNITVQHFEVGPSTTEDELQVLQALGRRPPPPPIMEFYRRANGVELLWHGSVEGRAVQGSINIVPILVAGLRAPATEGGEPLEDVLWNDEFPADVLTLLKRMSIVERLAGTSAALTYLVDESDGRLFLVNNDDVRRIVPDFATTIGLLQRYAGADGLREHLTFQDWHERLRADETLQRIAAL